MWNIPRPAVVWTGGPHEWDDVATTRSATGQEEAGVAVSEDVAALERQGWEALSTGGPAALDFYGRVLDDDAVMLLPGGMVLAGRAQVLAAMGGPPWRSAELEDVAVVRPTPDTALVHYGVRARRDGAPEFSALMSSLYARRPGGWRLLFHQQTPR